ncbi:MAG: Mur ligase domain-containing protein, partial [Microvirgula sp.]
MNMLSLSAAADALYAVHTGPDADFARVVTDSRQVRPGDLFVALKGERFDAHDFVADVLAAGAVGAVVRCDFELDGAPLVKVPDTR